MTALFLLILLGILTYVLVRRLTSITRTPWWLLWLVVMMPVFVWTAWALVVGDDKPMPPTVGILPFFLSLILYWFLIQWGRISPAADSSLPQDGHQPQEAGQEKSTEKVNLRPINRTEEAQLQTCFPWSIYYLQNIEYRPQAIICRGQMRSKPEVAYQTIRENIESHFGDRFYVVFQLDPEDNPVFVLVPNPRSLNAASGEPYFASEKTIALHRERLTRPLLAIGLLLLTLGTTAAGWLEITGEPLSLNALSSGLPYALSLLTILGVHESAHYLAARRHQVQATLPYFIPFPPVSLFPFGTFGAFIQVRSPIPDRKALFDVGIAGPLCGFIVAIPFLLWGLAHSQVVPLPPQPESFNFRALDPDFSLLLTLLSKLMLGNTLTPETAIQLHPVAVASCLGLVVTAFNLMPVGQLDGGHIVHAMFGQRTGAAIGQVSRLLLLFLAFAQSHLLLWALLLFLFSVNDEPALNDVTELNNQRDFLGLIALGLLLLIILPAPGILSRLLNV